MADPKQKLTAEQIADAGLTGWQRRDDILQITYDTGDFATGLDLLNAIGAAAEAAEHHPDLTLTYPSLQVTLSSHDVGGITSRDIDLAGRIGELAAQRGVEVSA